MLQIQISTQPTRLDYTLRKAQLNLQSPPPKVQTETTPATLEIRQPWGELTIDTTPCRYSIGFKNNTDFARDNASLGKQAVMDGIARITQEGTRYAQIESKSDAFVDIAANSGISEAPGITLGHIEAPDIHYQANPVQYNATAGSLDGSILPSAVQGDYQPGSIDIRVTQYSSIEFSTVDIKV